MQGLLSQGAGVEPMKMGDDLALIIQRDRWIRRWWRLGLIPNAEALDALDGVEVVDD